MSATFDAWWKRYTRDWAPQSQRDPYRVAQAAYSEGWADGAAHAGLGLEPSKRAVLPVDFEYPTGKPLALDAAGVSAPAPAVHALMEFRGRLMIATDAGLFELDPMANTAYRVPLHNDTTRSHEG